MFVQPEGAACDTCCYEEHIFTHRTLFMTPSSCHTFHQSHAPAALCSTYQCGSSEEAPHVCCLSWSWSRMGPSRVPLQAGTFSRVGHDQAWRIVPSAQQRALLLALSLKGGEKKLWSGGLLLDLIADQSKQKR